MPYRVVAHLDKSNEMGGERKGSGQDAGGQPRSEDMKRQCREVTEVSHDRISDDP